MFSMLIIITLFKQKYQHWYIYRIQQMYIISYENNIIMEQSNNNIYNNSKIFKQGQVKEELDAGKIPKSIHYFIYVLGRRS